MSITPWSVKGIESETRAAAKTAARKAGLTLGAWLNRTILDAAEGGPATEGGPANGHPAAPSVAPGEIGGATAKAMFETIHKMSARLEELEARLLQAPPTLSERLDRLTAEIEGLRDGAETSTEPLERAIARLSERVQRLEFGGPRPGDPGPRKRFGIGRGR